MKVNRTPSLAPAKMPNSLQDSKVAALLIRSFHTRCPSSINMIKCIDSQKVSKKQQQMNSLSAAGSKNINLPYVQ